MNAAQNRKLLMPEKVFVDGKESLDIQPLSSTRRAPAWFFGMTGSIADHCSAFSQKGLLMPRSVAASMMRITICHH